MERVVPWAALVALITPCVPECRRGRPPFAVGTMLHIHFMQQWFTLSEPEMEEALHDVSMFRKFAGLTWQECLPDETTILWFRRLPEEHSLAPQTLLEVNELFGAKGLLLRGGAVVDGTLIAAPSSAKNASSERDSQIKQRKKGNRWYFRMQAHIGVDADSGPVHTVRATACSMNHVVEATIRVKVAHPIRVSKRHSAKSRDANADWRRTPRRCTRFLRCPTCGWCTER
jgi:transposase, IS5 family